MNIEIHFPNKLTYVKFFDSIKDFTDVEFNDYFPNLTDIFEMGDNISSGFGYVEDDEIKVSIKLESEALLDLMENFLRKEDLIRPVVENFHIDFSEVGGRDVVLASNYPTLRKLMIAYKLSFFRDYTRGKNNLIGELIERAISNGGYNSIHNQMDYRLYPEPPFESKHQKSLYINNSLTPIEVLESICKEVCETKEINGIVSGWFDYNRDGNKFQYIYNLFDNKVYTDTIIKPKVEVLTVSPSVGGRILYSLLISIKATKDEIIKYIVRYISLVSGEFLANLTDDNKYGLISVTRNSLYLLPCSITPAYTYDEDDVFEGENGVEVNFLINSRFFHEPFYVVIHLDDFLLNHEIIYHRNLNMVMKAVNTVYQKVEDLAEFLKHTF